MWREKQLTLCLVCSEATYKAIKKSNDNFVHIKFNITEKIIAPGLWKAFDIEH